MPESTVFAPCPDCGSDPDFAGLDEHGDECTTCGGEGELPADQAARIAAEHAEDAQVRLVVHLPALGLPPLRLIPLTPREALQIALAAAVARVPVERLPGGEQQSDPDELGALRALDAVIEITLDRH